VRRLSGRVSTGASTPRSERPERQQPASLQASACSGGSFLLVRLRRRYSRSWWENILLASPHWCLLLAEGERLAVGGKTHGEIPVQYLPEPKIRSSRLLRPPARLSYRQIHPPIVLHSTLNPSLVRVCRANIELRPNSLQTFLVPFYRSDAIARTSALLSITSDKPRCCDVGRAGCLWLSNIAPAPAWRHLLETKACWASVGLVF
jgi:hypothetical protein